ncbi:MULTISPECIES: glycoside hydrolase family 127 protein [Geobacillus]|uniref:Glycoside hydrolase family 127 protein n=1 Tax=Geobacillus zalihae TaxID=213419 RepID=A0A7H1RXX5_9BACL|nr:MULTISPECIES: beta-L-arabinofuranosidase domain-containing protein [Geobacillus]QNU19114.1 glycoside hydrolase family 127 protein [Geobacillus zalihae]
MIGGIKVEKATIRANVNDRFWKRYIDVVRNEVVPYQWEALNDRIPDAEPSHAIKNFRIAAGESDGEFYGMVFQDSDVAKWLEAVAYLLEEKRDSELEALADDVIELLGRAQQPDGYLNTYYTVKEPGKRWTNLRDNHELYCAGHLIEAAVAYFQATGKRRFLDIMCKYADYIGTVFGRGEGQIPGYDGHQEIELALLKLYEATGNENYLKLSQYFIDQRGQQPHYFDQEKEARGETKPFWYDGGYRYHQAHIPVREQKQAVGHAVRALYMYTAMAGLAAKTGDESLKQACQTLWENVTKRQMYITGGVGSSAFGESFTFDFDLPNDTVYAETCASIALVFWARRMLELEMDGKYADVMERALYNGTISGMDLDGKRFFYVNSLEVWPKACERHDKRHVKPVRQKWFSCACCPPNLARLIASIGHYIYSQTSDALFVHLYVGSNIQTEIGGRSVEIVQETNYPWDGTVRLTVSAESAQEFTLGLRIPGWCRGAEVTINGENVDIAPLTKKGYAYIRRVWRQGDEMVLHFSMPVERIKAHPQVRVNAGKVALQRGPIVYCLEEVDNGPNLANLFLPRDAQLEAHFEPDLLEGVVVITGTAERVDESAWNDELYRPIEPRTYQVPFRAIPYYAWCNRGEGEMTVWVNEK